MIKFAIIAISLENSRGAAHNAWNLKLRICSYKTKVTIVFHNLRGYNSHLIMSGIGKIEKCRG